MPGRHDASTARAALVAQRARILIAACSIVREFDRERPRRIRRAATRALCC